MANIPKMTLSASQFRTYGAGALQLDDQEADAGCPRLYYEKYVSDNKLPQEWSYALDFGRFFHQVLYLMEEGRTPDEALEEALDVGLPLAAWEEAREDLTAYLNRGASPSDNYAVLETETDLRALLYEDEDFGPVYYRGILDVLSVDIDRPNVLHITDYKTNRTPPSEENLAGDVQMRGYHWLVEKNAEKWISGKPTIVTHYDAVKFREVRTLYTRAEIEDWESWAIAVARKILRDEEFAPRLNAGCPHCPVRLSCPAFKDMPKETESILGGLQGLSTPEELIQWRVSANAARLALEKSVKAVDVTIGDLAKEGPITGAGHEASLVTRWTTVTDVHRLQELLGEEFIRVVSVTKGKVEALIKDWEPSEAALVMACFDRVVSGTGLSIKKAK